MTTKNAIKKLEKAGYKVEHVHGERNRLFRSVINKGESVLEFLGGSCDDDSIQCIGVRAINDHSDSMTDYCAFVFYKNLTQVLR